MFIATDSIVRMDFLELVSGRVMDSMNLELSKDYIAKEVFLTLQQMHPIKDPSHNGMLPVFFHKHCI